MLVLDEATRLAWVLNVTIQVGLLSLLIARNDYRRFPAFCSYLVINLLQSAAFALFLLNWAHISGLAWKIGWATQGVVVLARGVAVGELCYHTLSQYKGIWAMGWRLLAGIGVTVLVVAIALGRHDFQTGIVTLDLGSELSIAAVTALLFAFAKYYDVPLEEPMRTMGIAFCLYSCCYVVNDLLLQKYLKDYQSVWNLVGTLAFLGSLTIWVSAFYKRAEARTPQPRLLDAEVYRSLIPEVNRRLAGLNEQLSEFWKVRSPHP